MRLKLALILFLCWPPLVVGQFTLVSGTIKDPSGLPYANGTILPTLVISGSPRFSTPADGGYAPPTQPSGLDGKGSFTVQLADVNQLIPAGGTWSFHVCSAAGTVQPGSPITGGPVCFDLVGIAVTGTMMDISAQLSAAAPPLTAIPTTIIAPQGSFTGAQPQLKLGSNGGASGQLALLGSTSGAATFTAPAVADTVTNPVVSSNYLSVPGLTGFGTPAVISGVPFNGLFNGLLFKQSTNDVFAVGNVNPFDYGLKFGNSGMVTWAFGAQPTVFASDTGLSRGGAGILACGNGQTLGDTSCQFKAAAVISAGTTFTSNGGCSEGPPLGGATAGALVVNTALTCTTVVTMGSAATAPHGWSCSVWDITTTATVTKQTNTTFTTASFTLTTPTPGDTFTFACTGF